MQRGGKWRTLDDLIKDAKSRPGIISYGSTGIGTDDHLALVLFQRLTGTSFSHVPFNGAGPLRTALVGGHVDVAGLNLGEVMPHQERMLVLAGASDGRSRLGPEVPTFKEQGVDLVFSSERGIVAPRGLPAEIRARLATALRAIANDPEFRKQMQTQFTEMDYLEGDAWKARLDKANATFQGLWQAAPWSETK